MQVDYFSQSKVKTWRRCPKAWDYRYNQGLVRKVSAAPLTRGTTGHAMLEAQILNKDPMVPYEEYRKWYNGLWAEEREEQTSPEDILSLFTRYNRHWANDGLDYQGRAEIEISVSHKGLEFRGIIDALPRDLEGHVWVSDHKFMKSIPDDATRFSDIQTVLYYWGLREQGEKASGILWDYIRTKPPAIPEELKRGGLTQRANIDTDYETYMAEILRLGLDPTPYRPLLEKLKKNVFFQRVKLPSPSPALIENVVSDFFDTATEILEATKCPRNMTYMCKSCTYFPICSEEVRGSDSSFTRKRMFTLREAK